MSVDEVRQQAMRQCYKCKHKRSVPGNAHIRCANPSETMMGDKYGQSQGWWYYPALFDPTWNLTICDHFDGGE